MVDTPVPAEHLKGRDTASLRQQIGGPDRYRRWGIIFQHQLGSRRPVSASRKDRQGRWIAVCHRIPMNDLAETGIGRKYLQETVTPGQALLGYSSLPVIHDCNATTCGRGYPTYIGLWSSPDSTIPSRPWKVPRIVVLQGVKVQHRGRDDTVHRSFIVDVMDDCTGI